MTHKHFSLIILGAAFLCAAATILFWHAFTKSVFYGCDSHGDLSRIGSVTIEPPATKNIPYLKHHAELREYLTSDRTEKFDVLTIGDSFSDGVGGAYYQDYLADKYGIKIINSAGTKRYNSWYQLMLLYNLGYLEELGVKTVIFEIGERGVQNLQTLPAMPAITREEYEKDRRNYKEPTPYDMVPTYTIISTTMGSANIKFIKNKLYDKSHEFSAGEDVFKEKLTIPAFTNPGDERTLYFYHDDLNYLNANVSAAAVNDTLNRIDGKLKEKGIDLVFFAVPDKSDLYFPYIERERNIPENNFYANIRPLEKKYIFIDAKKLLRAAVAGGEQDLFWADDTHWSFKSQQIVGDEIYKALVANRNNRQ